MDLPASDLRDDMPRSARRSRGRTGLRSQLTTGLLIAGGLGVVAAGFAFRGADLHIQTVLSGSMRPTISPGDLAITQGVPVESLRVGDVIVFAPPDGTKPVLHRIASREGDALTTKGDANSVADPWRISLQGPTGYRLLLVVPLVGWLVPLRGVALIGAGLIVALLILLEIRKGVRGGQARVAS